MSSEERVFESCLESLARDGRACATFVYVELTLRHLIATVSHVREALESHRGFWRAFLAALRTAGIVALDRLYDEERNPGSAAAALRYAERHRGLFTRARLNARRSVMAPGADGGQDVAEAFELKAAGLEPFFDELDAMRAVYAGSVQPMRAHVIANLAVLSPVGAGVASPEIADLERLAVFPLRLHRALYLLYYAGQAPRLEDVPIRLDEVLDWSQEGEAWEHQRAAKSVLDFLQALTAGQSMQSARALP